MTTRQLDDAHGEAPARRHHRRRWLLAIAAAVVLLLGVAGGFRAWLTREPRPVSVGEAVDRYRASGGPVSPGLATALQPGVYVYATSGQESVDALGGDSHAYPDSSVVTVKQTDCGYTMTWTPVAERADETRLCRNGGGIVEAGTSNSHTFFHISQSEQFTCDPGAWWLPPASVTSWTATCRSADTTTIRTARVVGTEPLTIGSTTVGAVHIHFDDAISGSSTGSAAADWWLDPRTGLALRQHTTTQTASETQIGHVSFHETIDLELTSLIPQT